MVRAISLGLIMALMLSLLSAWQIAAAPRANAATVSCVNTAYAVDWNSGIVRQIQFGAGGSAAGSTVSAVVGDLGPDQQAFYNGLAVSGDGTTLFAAGGTTIYRMDVATGATQTIPVISGIDGGILGGAINPQNGQYIVLSFGSTLATLYAYDPATNTWLGRIGSFPLNAAGMNATNISDIAIDTDGIAYITANTTSNGHSLYRINGALPSTSGNAPLAPVLITTNLLANNQNIGSLAFGSNGNLYLGQIASPQIIQLNPSSGALVDQSAAPIPGLPVDFASCSTPSTLTVQKNITSRFKAADQFGLSITGLRTPATATTSGTATGIQPQKAGTAVVTPGSTYTVAESAASGTNLSDYSTTWQCINGDGTEISSGTGVSFSYSPPPVVDGKGQAVTCTFTNAPLQRSYTVAKSVSASSLTPGSSLTYSVTVTNTGQLAYTTSNPASFTDNLSDVLDDATYQNDATGGATVTGNTLNWSGALAVGETRTITYSVVANTPGQGNHILNNAVSPTGVGGTCATTGGCTTSTPVQALRITKTADRTQVVPGQQITYTVTVQNVGAVDYTTASPATFSDDLTAVLDDATWSDNATASSGTVTYTQPTLSWSGAIASGGTVTVTYSVVVNDPPTGDSQINNAVTSTTPGNNCPVGNSDPACIVRIPSSSYTVSKVASATVASPGDTVTYTVTVSNTGVENYTAANPASFSDDLTAVLDDATYNGDATNGATVTANTLTWSGALPAGQTVTITYSVKVNNPDTGDKRITNSVVPTSPGGRCPTPGDCTTTTNVRSYTVAKTSSVESAEPGSIVTYTVTVTNTGTASYPADGPASFADDLTDVLDDATYNNDVTATVGTASFTSPTLSWTGALETGTSVTVTYSVTVNAPGAGNQTLTNTVTPTGPAGNCATDGGCTTTTPVQSFSVVKSASSASVTPGSVLTYTVTVVNTGQVA
ncbi:beta strand repeat-containing protein [Agreia sp. Leaf335]|uniref:beta strand repeat-containing protein n=1 Tax=Agreia sp. Leaf335 TaxID=1736340 RepID=UPI00138F8C8C|nr:isopeptide-forming domain-containing fimbrial protein [Agreia sp. Leaf335]